MPPPVIVRWREMKLNSFNILNNFACQASIRQWTPAAIYCILPPLPCSWSMRQPTLLLHKSPDIVFSPAKRASAP